MYVCSSKSAPMRAGGFTLIELVVVLAILVAIAGLVIPKLDFLRRSADTATAASTSQDLMTNLQLYRTIKGVYPDQFDSLLDSSNTAAISPLVFGYDGNAGHPPFVVASTLPPFTGAPGSDQSGLSYAHVLSENVNDLVTTSTFASDAGATSPTPRLVDTSAAVPCAKITPTGSIARSIYGALGVPAGTSVVALGVGPRCKAVGATLATPPLYSGLAPDKIYCRYVALFAVYTSGKRADLVGIVDATGQTVSAQIKAYNTNSPE